MKFNKIIVLGIFAMIISSIFSFSAKAGDWVQWHSTNIQLLKGWDYDVGEEGRTIITLEHANSWKYGDFFMFIDGTRFDPGKTTAYGEFAPRLSLSKISGKKLSYGIVKDVLISTMYEKGKSDIRAYLYGGAIDLDIPGFKFFKTNFFIRDNPEIQNERTWQITLAWNSPFEIGQQKFLFEGFADFAGDEGRTYHKNQMIVPRLLMDIGRAIGKKEGKLYGGIEYQYWHNKFGIDGKTESVPQLQLKWVF
ncbi:MAG: outer membrane protein OmpK [Rickettsiales bacterium]|nr:DUF5020 domain-containing protein [Pseudomonadota bacterium]MDA0966320.1 DUF5020 domain-containing protein [Pseudomonadota bacterium]MDG4543952.1 outer membrane protein OmpK [Rickettsiales bacterium]MDG4545446.1 outer membrane protein OmpK [Rickettsiales bacterium]MDG4547895.1 outer membrane protein OmpK [Rickettsiales bacterium]